MADEAGGRTDAHNPSAGQADEETTRPPRLSLVVSTVGRPDALARLLRSLEALEPAGAIELILVDQDEGRACTELLERWSPAFPHRAVTSGRGLSVGRNVGLGVARGELVGFPDDDCWYEPDTVATALRRMDTGPLDGVSGRALTGDGQPAMLRWLDRPARVTARNYYRTTISFTFFLRRALVEAVGGFDEGLGAGSPGPFGAGEESDLVLRLLAAGVRIDYDPAIVVHHDEPRSAADDAFVAKMERYGAGQGLLWRRHRASPVSVGYLLGRKAGGALVRRVRGDAVLSRADVAYLRGCVRGLRSAPPAPMTRPELSRR